MRAAVGFLIALCCSAASVGQQAPPGPEADLETVREWAESRMAAQGAALKDMIERSMAILQSPLADDTTVVRETIARLGSKAALQPALVIAKMTASQNAQLRRRLGEVLVATQDPTIGAVLLESADKADEEVAAILVQAAGRIQAKSVVPALVARLESTRSPLVLGEIVVALARVEAKEALPAARRLLDHSDPRARLAGATALGLVGSGKDDIDALRRLASGPEPALRDAALRSLGRFKGNLDALRVLHDAVVSTDPTQVKAALEGLEQAGTKDLTPHFLLQVVKSGPPDARERAAKLLLRFGNPEGIRLVVQPERAEADKAPGNRNAQVAAGDRCRELGWYEGAIPFYDRALSGRSGAVADQQILVALARCYARLKRFDDAKRKLRDARYTSFRTFADDADFAEMREHPSFRESFK